MEAQIIEMDKRVISIQIEHKKARDIEIRIQELEKQLELLK